MQQIHVRDSMVDTSDAESDTESDAESEMSGADEEGGNESQSDSSCVDELLHITDDESEPSSESDSDSDSDEPPAVDTSPQLQIAQPSQVLERYLHIASVPGIQQEVSGYRLCGDNIDKTIRSRYMRSNKRNTSLHYFHVYAVKNRVDTSSLPEYLPQRQMDVNRMAVSILPTRGDDAELRKNISTIISRILVAHMAFFETSFDDVVSNHIEHEFYQEMSTKSTVVRVSS